MTRPRPTTPHRGRARERAAMAGVFALAAVAGLVAAQLGTPRAWENTPAPTSSSTAPPLDNSQRNP